MDTSTFVVQKKNIAVHSEDRDVTKWPTPTHFELDLPVDYKNVVSIGLNEIYLPTPLYVFSSLDQNTKMTVSVNGEEPVVVEIMAGNYSPSEMALELTGKLNEATNSFFRVLYNAVSQKYVFTNSENFTLFFKNAESYDACGQVYFDQATKWGLGSFLGFQKENYEAVAETVKLYSQSISIPNGYVVYAPNISNLNGDSAVYLELTTYNNIDESSFTDRSSDLYYGTFGGKHNSSFAKIPLRPRSSRENYLLNIFFSDPPLERLQRLRFRLRYHDGRPVHLHGKNYNFSIELTLLRNDGNKLYTVNKNNYKLS